MTDDKNRPSIPSALIDLKACLLKFIDGLNFDETNVFMNTNALPVVTLAHKFPQTRRFTHRHCTLPIYFSVYLQITVTIAEAVDIRFIIAIVFGVLRDLI